MIPVQNIRKTAFWMGIVLPVIVLVAMIWVTHATSGQFDESFASVTHTYKVIALLEDAQARIADAETGQRGYFVTGKEDYFTLYGTAISAINGDIQQLRILASGNSGQQRNLDRFQNLINSRLQTNSIPPNTPKDKMAVALTDQGRETINEFRSLLFEMRQQEGNLLASRQQKAEEQFLFDQAISLALVAVTVIALIAIIGTVMRMEHLRQIVTVCAWTGQIKDGGEWVRMEDYLKKRFGVSVSHGLSKEAADKMSEEMRRAKKQNAGNRPGN